MMILMVLVLEASPMGPQIGVKTPAGDEHTKVVSIEVDGLTREYRLHVPPSLDKTKPAALLFVLHGGGSNARQAERFIDFSELSDKEGFIAVYPEAIEGHWNDGRGSKNMKSQRENIDDVKFVAAIIGTVSTAYAVDPKRVFATGASNGGIMSHRLGADLSDRIVAIAPVISSIAEPLDFKPVHPVAVLIIQGTADPLMPYKGGGILRGRHGKVIPGEEAVRRWATHNGCGEAKVEDVPDKDTKDGCTVKKFTYAGGKADVVFYRVDGGGHNSPGGDPYLPERTIGKTCRDFDATTTIWEFFESHPRP